MTLVWTRLAIVDVQAITRFIAQNKGVGPPNFILQALLHYYTLSLAGQGC